MGQMSSHTMSCDFSCASIKSSHSCTLKMKTGEGGIPCFASLEGLVEAFASLKMHFSWRNNALVMFSVSY